MGLWPLACDGGRSSSGPHPIPPPPGGPTPTSWADHQALFLAFISKAWPPKCKLAKNTKRCEIASSTCFRVARDLWRTRRRPWRLPWRAQAGFHQGLRMARSQRPRHRPGMLPASLSPAASRPSPPWAARAPTRAVGPAVIKVHRHRCHLSRSSGGLHRRTVSTLRGRRAYRARPWSPSSALIPHKCLTPVHGQRLGMAFRCHRCHRLQCRPASMRSTARASRLVRLRWRRLVCQENR